LPASRSRRSSPKSSRTWRRPLPISTRLSCHLARGHRRRSPACFESESEGHIRWSVTRPGRDGACRHSAGRQARAV
jgi:hypothetical protein